MKTNYRRRNPVPPAATVEVDYDARTWTGNYAARNGRIDVWCEYGRKETASGGVPD